MRLWSVRPPRFPHTDGPVGGRTMVFDTRHQTHPGIRRPARLIRQDRGPAVIILLAAVLLLWSPAETRADCPAAPLTSPDDLVISFRTGEGGPQAAPGALLTSTVKDGMLVYDGAAKVLKLCNGTSWITLQSTSGAGAAAGSVAGAVQFRGAGGNLAADDTNFVWDDTNNRLGIGTATPTVSIESTGQAIFGLGRIYDHNTNYTGFGHKSLVTNGTAYAIGQSSAGNTIINATAGQSVAVRIGGGATQPVSINSAGITFSSGTAGAPNASALLDMSSTTKGFLPPRMTTAQVTAIATPADGLIVYDSDTDTIKLRANGAWVDLLAGAGSEADPQVGTLTANKWCSANAGGTAIDCTADAPATGAAGTASEVQFRNSGTGAFAADSGFYWDNTNKYLMIDHTNWTGLVTRSFNALASGGAAPSLVLVRGRGTPAVPSPPLTNDILGLVAFRSYQETGGAELRGYAAEDQGTGLRGGYMTFLTTPVGTATGQERMRIAANGFVGIGTTNPQAGLHVVSTGMGVRAQAGGGGPSLYLENPTSLAPYLQYPGGSILQESATTLALRAGANTGGTHSLNFTTGSTTRMLIDAAGNVGIGTSNPATTLDVVGDATITKSVANQIVTVLKLQNNANSATPGAALDLQYINTNSLGRLAITYNNGYGNLGLWSKNWGGTLQPRYTIGNAGAGVAGWHTWYKDDGNAGMVMDPTGNVGIGAAAPRARLEVDGNIRLQAGAPANDLAPFGIAFEDNGDTGMFMTNNTSAADGDLHLYVNAISRLAILGSGANVGSVGIGTTTPQSLLHVAGGVQLGDDTASCVAGKYGTLRYNSSNLQMCEASGWATVGSAGGSSYMQKRLGTDWAVTASTVMPFNTVLNSYGSNITAAGNQMTLKAGSSYMLLADIRAGDMANEAFDYQWYNVTASSFIGNTASEADGNNLEATAVAFIRPNVDTTVELRSIGLAGAVTALAGYSYMSAVELGGGSGGGGGGGGGTPGGADTQVQFNNSGAFGGDASLVWNNTSKWLGIGTSSYINLWNTTQKLIIAGTNNSGIGILAAANTTAPAVISTTKTRGAAITDTTAVQSGDMLLALQANAADGTVVNIPAGRLSVSAEGTVSTGIVPGRMGLWTADSAGALTERVRIDSAGNVGVGTTSPTGRLHVATAGASAMFVDAYANTSAVQLRRANGTLAAPTAVLSGDVIGSVSFAGYGATAFSGGKANMRAIASENWTDTATGVNLVFATTPTGSSTAAERVRIDQAGNVGIGTTAPYRRLSVLGNGIIAGSTTSSAGVLLQTNGTAGEIAGINHDNNTYNALQFATSGTPAMFISTGNNVGIGTTNPQSMLQVAGGIQVGDDAATCPGAANVKVGTLRYNSGNLQVCGTGGWANVGSGGAGSTAAIAAWATFNGTNGTIIASGNVSSVTRSSVGRWVVNFASALPDTNYTVNATCLNTGAGEGAWTSIDGNSVTPRTTTYVRIINWNNAGSAQVDCNEVYVAVINGTGSPSSQWQSGSGLIYYNGGNVGIGTTGPAYPLHIASGSAQYPTALGILPSTHASSRRAALTIDDWLLLQDATGNGTKDFGIWQSTPGIMRMYINTTGNVGIGTTSPADILNVHTTTGSTGLRISAAAGASYLNLVNTAGSVINNISNTPMSFTTNNTERMRIDAAGNVGIGASAPATKLEIRGNIGGTGAVRTTTVNENSAGSADAVYTSNDGSYLAVQMFGSAYGSPWTDTARIISGSASTFFLGTDNTAPLVFMTQATERMRVDSAGNVGIGTSSISHKLTVSSSTNIPIYATSTAGTYNAIRGDSAGYYGLEGRTSSAAHAGVLGYANNTSIYGMLGYSVHGVYGVSTASGHGVYGYNNGANYGVRAHSVGSYGLMATTDAATYAIYGKSNAAAGSGVLGYTTDSLTYGILGYANAYGVYGYQSSPTVGGIGVYARSTRSDSYGFLGYNDSAAYYCYIGYGNSYSIACSGPTSGVSDERLKKDIVPLSDSEGLDAIMNIQPVHYYWKDEKRKKREIGFLAQDVEEVLPELVGRLDQSDPNNPNSLKDIRALQYDRLAAPIVKAVQQLKVENDNLKEENTALRNSLEDLRTRIEKLEMGKE